MAFRSARYGFLVPIVAISLSSCAPDFGWQADARNYAETGLAAPDAGTGDLAGTDVLFDQYQVGSAYDLSIPVINEKGLAIDYEILTNVSNAVDGATGFVAASGQYTDAAGSITVPVTFASAADKQSVEFSLRMWSSVRSYGTVPLLTVPVETRPSPVIPCADATLTPIGAGSWVPSFSGDSSDGTAVVYWTYALSATDTDIDRVVFSWDSGSDSGTETFSWDSGSGSFGATSFTVDGVSAGTPMSVSATVYDSMTAVTPSGLASTVVSTGSVIPGQSASPVFTRGSGASVNVVTVTVADAATRLWCRVDAETAYTLRSAPFTLNLSGTHFLSAYAEADDVLDSSIVSVTYPAMYSASYASNGADSGSAPVDAALYATGTDAIVAGAGSLSRAGYAFLCWNAASDGSGANYPEGSAVTLFSDATLYPVWRLDGGDMTFPVGDFTIRLSGGAYALALDNGASSSITIPSWVSSIESGAFAGRSSLAEVTVLNASPPALSSDVFSDCAALADIFVPTGCEAAYEAAPFWSAYAAFISD